jgi:hypothetical protein
MRRALVMSPGGMSLAAAVALAIAVRSGPAAGFEVLGPARPPAEVRMRPALQRRVVDALMPAPEAERTDDDRRAITRAQAKRNRKDAARAARGH